MRRYGVLMIEEKEGDNSVRVRMIESGRKEVGN